jgi:hypothetical protein
LIAQLRTGEKLIGYYDRMVYKKAPYLPDERKFNDFEDQYKAGAFFSREFFAINERYFDRYVDFDRYADW